MSNRALLQDIQRRQREARLASINPDKVDEVMRVKESYVKYENLQAFEKAVAKLLADMEQEIEYIRSRAETLVEDAKESIDSTLDDVKKSTEKQVDKSVGSILDDRMDAVREDVDKSISKVKDDVATLLADTEDKLIQQIRNIEKVDADTIDSLKSAMSKLVENFNSLKGASKQQILQSKNDISKSVSSIQSSLEERVRSLEKDLFDSIDEIETLKKAPPGGVPKGLIEKINSYMVQRSVSIPVTTDQGGLGTTTRPTTGQVPVGNADGTYSPGTVSGSAHIIQEEGVSLTARSKLNFIGAAVTATDDAVNDATKITITASASSLTVTSTSATPYSASANEVVLMDATAGAKTVNLPAAATAGSGGILYVKKVDTSTNTVTVDGNAAETIDGSLTYVITTPYDSIQLVSDGSNWSII